MDTALRALNRFGLGARVGERGRLGDPRTWLRAQLSEGPPRLSAPAGASDAEIGDAVAAFRDAGQDDAARQAARRRLREIAVSEAQAALEARITTDRPFVERLVSFWSNHFCISTRGEPFVDPLAGHYERQVVRPHVLGRFGDMLLASARHPAMLIYLDNFRSIGPDSPAATLLSRRGEERGLNENYARELLELHTLGVDGGYTQTDVQELARMLTGWTISGVGRGAGSMTGGSTAGTSTIDFVFQESWHEPGTKTLLGVQYDEAGVAEAERAIASLARHPSTADFIAGKLVAHFVADVPPPAAVAQVAQTFRETDGDLAAVSRELVELPEAWDDTHTKFRTPQDSLVATLRAMWVPDVDRGVLAVLDQLRHPLWAPASPQGYPDTMPDWADPDSLLNRAELARSISRLVGSGQDAPTLLDVLDLPDADPLRQLAGDPSIAADERLALVLAGPEFQWR